MSDIRVDIAKAFTDDGTQVRPFYGTEPREKQITVTGASVQRFLTIVDLDHLGDFMRDTEGLIEAGRLMLFTVATRPDIAVDQMKAWIKILYVSSLGGFGEQGSAPFDLQGVRFWRFRPLGFLNQDSFKPEGQKYYLLDQLVEFAAAVI